MALENLVDGMTGLQMANAIKNNFDKVLDAESAENKAENAGKSIKTDYDATRYIELQLADGTPVKMKMDVFCQAIAPVVAGVMGISNNIFGLSNLVIWRGSPYGARIHKTNISVASGYSPAKAFLYLMSYHSNNGDSTWYEFGVIRRGYDGSYLEKTVISKRDGIPALVNFTASSDGFIQFSVVVGDANVNMLILG